MATWCAASRGALHQRHRPVRARPLRTCSNGPGSSDGAAKHQRRSHSTSAGKTWHSVCQRTPTDSAMQSATWANRGSFDHGMLTVLSMSLQMSHVRVLQSGTTPELELYNAALRTAAGAGDAANAERVHSAMVAAGVKPDAAAASTLVVRASQPAAASVLTPAALHMLCDLAGLQTLAVLHSALSPIQLGTLVMHKLQFLASEHVCMR